jgi:hypothetical protein
MVFPTNPPFGPPTPGQIRSAVAQQRLALREYKEVTTGTEAEAEKLSDEDFFQEKVGFIFGISWNILYAEIICIYIYILIYIYIYVYTCTYTYIYIYIIQNSRWWNLGKKRNKFGIESGILCYCKLSRLQHADGVIFGCLS